MTIGPEHVAAIICAVVGYALVSAFFRFSARRGARDEESAQSDSKAGAHSESKGSSQQRSEDINKQWFEILGVSPSASFAEIKAAYRTKISGYHPDKVASLADELRELAEERSKAINDAYTTAMRLRK